MASRGKIFVLIFVIAVLIAAFWIINAQLSITTETTSQAGLTGPRPPDTLAKSTQAIPITGMAISVIGASPVERAKNPVEKKQEKTVFQSENPVSGSSIQPSSGPSASAAVSIKKAPASEKKKEIDSKGIIIL